MPQEKCKICGQLEEKCECFSQEKCGSCKKKESEKDGALGVVAPVELSATVIGPGRGQWFSGFSFKTVILKCRKCDWHDEKGKTGNVLWKSIQWINCESCRKREAEAVKLKALEEKDEQISYEEKKLNDQLKQRRLAFEEHLKKDEPPDDMIALLTPQPMAGCQMHIQKKAATNVKSFNDCEQPNGPNQPMASSLDEKRVHGDISTKIENSPFQNLGSNGNDMMPQQGHLNSDLNHETPSQNLQHEAENEHLKAAEEQIKLREQLLEKKGHEAAIEEEKMQSRYNDEQEEKTVRRLIELNEVKIQKFMELNTLRKKHAQ
uniref:Uncharacterized protein n=1 Tax=Amphimedon queenslandica TaxID=400682 RepID=A0A1X7TQ35_AMPQE